MLGVAEFPTAVPGCDILPQVLPDGIPRVLGGLGEDGPVAAGAGGGHPALRARRARRASLRLSTHPAQPTPPSVSALPQ
jgi:hypothetical protein